MHLKPIDYFFVGIQFLLFLIYIIGWEFERFSLPYIVRIIGLILTVGGLIVLLLAILQLNKNLSPFPMPKTNSELVQSGLYKYIRHPIYTGILLNFFGFALYSESILRLSITIFLYILFIYKSNYEEKMLSRQFKDYSNYKKKTGRFFPVYRSKR